MKRQTRANIALFVLFIAGFLGADLIAYGSEAGYRVAQSQGLIAGLSLFAVALFAWNVATYKK